MNLGLKKDEVKVVPYTDDWPREFLRVKKEIHQDTNINENHIQQIGRLFILVICSNTKLDDKKSISIGK
ncbi:GrpB family protein [Peribacillus simplex]|uniref:GrpB family protein n=1 Tax=Peribacillus simplex TaxID=1478 RepID=UPI0021AB041B|nr:GrpB family protein [Peribacillus simplex]